MKKVKKPIKVDYYRLALKLAMMFNSSEFEAEGVKYIKIDGKYIKA